MTHGVWEDLTRNPLTIPVATFQTNTHASCNDVLQSLRLLEKKSLRALRSVVVALRANIPMHLKHANTVTTLRTQVQRVVSHPWMKSNRVALLEFLPSLAQKYNAEIIADK